MLTIFFSLNRKKFVKNCQIRHSRRGNPGTQTAIGDGTAQPAPILEEVAAPEGAEVEVGGKSCKWCGSQTHLR